MVTATQVRAIAKSLGGSPRADMVNAIASGWDDAAAAAKLTTRKRAAAFIGQICTETGGLQILSESGAYSAARIMQVFGVSKHSARVTSSEAKAIAALPIAKRGPALFNRVYGSGNPTKAKEFQNTGPNDGWLYRGGGMMQCTGKSNYAKMAKKTGLPLVEHPEFLHEPNLAFKVAYLDWAQDGRANKTADAIGGTGATLKASLATNRKVINGGTNGLDQFVQYYAKALTVLADYEPPALPATLISHEIEAGDVPEGENVGGFLPPEGDEVELEPPKAPPNVQPLDEPDAVGDPQLYSVQRRLRDRRYSPGKLDGRWGSGTAAALAGFRNDRGVDFPMPRNLEMFHDVGDVIREALTEAEGERWFRPVSEERAKADPKLVKELAPEVVPQKRNWFVALWGSIVAFFSAIYDSVSGYVSQAWDFWTDHKDVVDDHPGIMSGLWEKVAHIPAGVWLGLAGAVLAFVAYNSRAAIKTSIEAVKTGERQ